VADQRDDLASQRTDQADQRDDLADQREHAADTREARIDQLMPTAMDRFEALLRRQVQRASQEQSATDRETARSRRDAGP
jgi:hypothetical protein